MSRGPPEGQTSVDVFEIYAPSLQNEIKLLPRHFPSIPNMVFHKLCLLKHEMALSTDGTESVCGEYAFPPLLFTPCFTYFIHSAILHRQITHVIYLVFYLLFVFYVYFTTPSMH